MQTFRTKRPRYEKSTKSTNVYGTNSLWYEKSGIPRRCPYKKDFTNTIPP